MLGSLLQQLVRHQPDILNEICDIYHRHGDGEYPPTRSELSSLLQLEFLSLSKVFVIVDALDECTNEDNMSTKLLCEFQKLHTSLHLLITSRRHIINVKHEFPDARKLDIRARDEDLKVYLEKRIRMEERLRIYVDKNPELGETIKNKIIEKADGMSVSHTLYIDVTDKTKVPDGSTACRIAFEGPQ